MATPATRRRRQQGRDRQRGVAAVFVGVTLLAFLLAMAFAIDVARLYNAQRNLQKLADLAAVDAARVAGGCLIGPVDFDTASAEAHDSLRRNNMPTGISVVVRAGRKIKNGDLFEFLEAPNNPVRPRDSIQVTLSQASPARVLPLFSGASGKTLQVRAAASSLVLAQYALGQTAGLRAPDIANRYFGNQLGSSLNLSLAGYRATSEANVTVGQLVQAQATAGVDLPDLSTPISQLGLLDLLLAALDETGDSAAAAAVTTYAAAAEAGRGVVMVVPADLLGLPAELPEALYDQATVNVGSLLASIADAVAGPGPIQFPIDLPPPLGNTTLTITKPGSSQPGSYIPGLDNTSVDSSDGAASVGGLAQLEVNLANPLTGAPLKLPVSITVRGQGAQVTEVQCPRRGLEKATVSMQAHGGGASISIGRVRDYQSDSGQITVEPAQLLSLPLAELLPGVPLPAAVAGQVVTIEVSAGPFEIGDQRDHALCFSGPPWPRPGQATQCDGSAATVGGVSTSEAVRSIPTAVGDVQLRVVGLGGLSPLLNGLVDSTLQAQVLTPISDQIQQLLNLLAAQFIPLLEGTELNIGGTAVGVEVKQVATAIYAR